jgi:SSS family solute:Na+ symporter
MLAAAQQLTSGSGVQYLDWVVIVVYGLGMLAIGVYYSLKTKTTEDYLLGGRSMGSSMIGLSLFSTLFSTITYLAIPGEMINKGPVALCWMFGLPVVYIVVCMVLIPRIMALPVTSGYELLEIRLGRGIRLLGSGIFLATRMLWMALIIHVTSNTILVPVLQLPEGSGIWVALIIGVITVLYTFMGGLRAVVLTDVIQTFILFGAAVISVILVTIKMGGVGAWWPTTWAPTWDKQPLFSLDPHVRVTVIGSIIWMTVWWICTAGSDQMAIQRYLATRDAPAARRAFVWTLASNIFVTVVLASLGFALLGFFNSHPEFLKADGVYLKTDYTMEGQADKLFPYFIVRFLPAGLTGLVISGLLAAAMSSLASGINSACSVITADFIDPIIGRAATEKANVRRNKLISLLVGLLGISMSLLIAKVPGNILEVTTRTNHVFVAPLFGLFLMAMFVPWATPLGTAVGALAGCVVAVFFAYWDLITGLEPLSFQYISLISLVVNLLISIPVSLNSTKSGFAIAIVGGVGTVMSVLMIIGPRYNDFGPTVCWWSLAASVVLFLMGMGVMRARSVAKPLKMATLPTGSTQVRRPDF